MKTINLQDTREMASSSGISSYTSDIRSKSYSGFAAEKSKFKKSFASKSSIQVGSENSSNTSAPRPPVRGSYRRNVDSEKQIEYIRGYFLRLLAKRDYSESELLNKAKQKEFEPEFYQPIIEEFKTKKWLDDQRFAENLIDNYKGQKGKNWITQKLAQKGISKTIIQELFETQKPIQPDQNVRELLERKHKISNWQEIDIKVKNKVIYFLCSRGFANAFEILSQWQAKNNK